MDVINSEITDFPSVFLKEFNIFAKTKLFFRGPMLNVFLAVTRGRKGTERYETSVALNQIVWSIICLHALIPVSVRYSEDHSHRVPNRSCIGTSRTFTKDIKLYVDVTIISKTHLSSRYVITRGGNNS